MPAERVVTFRPRTIVTVAAILVGIAIALWIVWISRQVLSWVFVALFLALALNPAVTSLQRHGVRRRGAAVGIVFVGAILLIAAVLAVLIGPLAREVSDFISAVPGYVQDLTHGRGPLGFLQTRYHIVDRLQEAVDSGAANRLAGGASTALSLTAGILTAIAAAVTIAFLTLFMLLEGPAWIQRFYGLLPEESQPRWSAVFGDIYRLVSGYITGNLLISAIAGTATTLVLLVVGVPYALALGLVVALLDLIPLAGATLGGLLITLVALTQSVTDALVVLAFFTVYQQAENHLLQPLVYGRTVDLSPLAVLVSVLIGAQVAGVLGALSAIPVAGTLQVLFVDWHRHRRRRGETRVPEPEGGAVRTDGPVPQPIAR